MAVNGLGGLGCNTPARWDIKSSPSRPETKKPRWPRSSGPTTNHINAVADMIVQTAPNPDTISKLVRALGPGSKLLNICVVGEVPVDTTVLVSKGASVHSWPSGHASDGEEAIRFALTDGVGCMIQRYPLEQAQQAVNDPIAGKPLFSNVLVMNR